MEYLTEQDVCKNFHTGLAVFRWVFYFVVPRVSRGIQEPRAQSVLQVFLDAATARSMTGWCAQHNFAKICVVPVAV